MSKLSLLELQQQMMRYLTEDDLTIEQQVQQQGNISNGVRLHIYQNAYYMRLKETIDNDHQCLGLYLGDDLFEQMVSGYIKASPSNNTSLRHFADLLPQFLASNEPFKHHPIISELAYFERLLMVAFDAADKVRFTREHLQQIPHQQWPSLVFRLHPSVQICHFAYNTVETWQALKQQQAPQEAVAQDNTWLLWRNTERLTQFRSLSAQENQLMQMLIKGDDFSHLCDYLVLESNEQEVTQLALNYLLSWIDDGILCNLSVNEKGDQVS